MARKKWQRQLSESHALLASRIKRRWQIALRRYVLEGKPASYYAPFFGLDIQKLRQWFQNQFPPGINWDDFGSKWQFEHIVPLSYFDMNKTSDLSLCWNFTNLRIELLSVDESSNRPLGLVSAKKYFADLKKESPYTFLEAMLRKLDSLQEYDYIETSTQINFLIENVEHVEIVRGFTSFEFEQLNNGKNIDEILKEANWLKKFNS